jgi:hypothetical protein
MCSPQFLRDNDTIAVINAVNLEDILRKIDPDRQPGHPVSFPTFDWSLPIFSAVVVGVSTSSKKPSPAALHFIPALSGAVRSSPVFATAIEVAVERPDRKR